METCPRTPRFRLRGLMNWPWPCSQKVVQQQLTELGLMPDFELVEQLRNCPEKKISVSPGMCVACDLTGKVSRQEDLFRVSSTPTSWK